MFNKLERKFGKYAVKNLINYLLIGYGIGYVMMLVSMFTPIDIIDLMTLEPYYIIHGFQFWRILTWVMIPPYQATGGMSIFFILIMIYFYWQLGTVLERNWGTFRFNAYIFGGLIFTVLGTFLYYIIYFLLHGTPLLGTGLYISTYYVNLSIFLAFAVSFPDMKVLLYFFIPIKMKWMAAVYAVLILIDIIRYPMEAKVSIISSLLNFLIFFLSTRNYRKISPKDIHRRNEFKRQYNAGKNEYKVNFKKEAARHKCAVCGRTELTNPELVFRFCSKCNGNYEYCNDHIFTHTHKT